MIMFGNGKVKPYTGEHAYIMRTEQFTALETKEELPKEGTSSNGWNKDYEGPDGKLYKKINPKFYDANGKTVTGLTENTPYFCSYDLKADGAVVEISANSFPGTLTYRASLWGNKRLTKEFGELLEAVA